MFLIRNVALLWIAMSILAITACAKEYSEPVVYLIPEGFVGAFHVVYNVTMDIEPEYEGDARLFRVTDSGVIHTSLPGNYGHRVPGSIRFYFVSADGSREEITNYHRGRIDNPLESRRDNKTYLMSGSISRIRMNFKAPDRSCEYTYVTYYVGTYADALDGKGEVDLGDYYEENGFPCDGELLRR